MQVRGIVPYRASNRRLRVADTSSPSYRNLSRSRNNELENIRGDVED